MKPTASLSALLALACAPAGSSAQDSAAPEPGGPGVTGTLLIGNKGENTLSFVDLASGRELGRAATGRMPHEIAVSPNGRQAAVVAYGGRTIDIFDIASRTKVRTVDLSPNAGPHGIVWLSDGRILVTTERSQSLTIVDTSRGDAVSAIPTGQQGTHMVAVSPDARRAYTANIQSGSVSVIDLAGGRLVRNIQLGGAPESLALTPDGRTLWVGDNEGARVQAFDTAQLAGDSARFAPVVNVSYTVAGAGEAEVRAAVATPLERSMRSWPGAERVESHVAGNSGWTQATLVAGSPVPSVEEVVARVRSTASSFPQGRTEVAPRILSVAPLAVVPTRPVPIRVAASPDGRWIVISNLGCGCLTIIDARTRAAVREIAVEGSEASRQVTLIFSADGRRLYAAETGRNRIAEVDLASGRVLRRLPAGAQGDGLAIAP